MSKFLNIYTIILIILICVLVFTSWQRREKAKLKKNELLEEKKFIKRMTEERERIKNFLDKKFKKRLYLSYSILLALFLSLSSVIASLTSQLDVNGIIQGAEILGGTIWVVGLYISHQSQEFKPLLTQLAPFLKKEIYGEHINIEAEIENGYLRIDKIDKKIKKLDKVIFA